MDRDPFVAYYEKQSVSTDMVEHFHRLRDLLLAAAPPAMGGGRLRVADIGCGAGAFSALIAMAGCDVEGLDINEALIAIAKDRARAGGLSVQFHVGSADTLPWPDASFDVVAMPELLEHVPNWQGCIAEAARILKRNGIVYLSTTNRLCPVQREFTLPLYSWYPGWLKQRCLRLALTDHREWVNHAQFPAVNWFDPYMLGAAVARLGLTSSDRFAIWAQFSTDARKRRIGAALCAVAPLRLLGHALTPGTMLIARKL